MSRKRKIVAPPPLETGEDVGLSTAVTTALGPDRAWVLLYADLDTGDNLVLLSSHADGMMHRQLLEMALESHDGDDAKDIGLDS